MPSKRGLGNICISLHQSLAIPVYPNSKINRHVLRNSKREKLELPTNLTVGFMFLSLYIYILYGVLTYA